MALYAVLIIRLPASSALLRRLRPAMDIMVNMRMQYLSTLALRFPFRDLSVFMSWSSYILSVRSPRFSQNT